MAADHLRDDAPVLPSTARALLHRVARAQSTGRAPSVVAGVVRDAGLVWSGGWGEVSGTVTDTQYRIGSITKTLTAVAVLQAVRDGLFELDAPIGTLSPVFAEHAYASRTVRQLLTHTSGLRSEPTGEWWERTPGTDLEELLTRNDGPGAFPPGQQHHYSNLGYALLGALLEHVRAASWWDLVRVGIVGPLGLARTTYLPQEPYARGFSVHPYASDLVLEPTTDTGAMAPAGQLWSTLADLARFVAFLGAGDERVLEARWLDLASHPIGAAASHRLRDAHGLGLQLVAGGSGMLRGHTGSMPGFQAALFADPASRTGAVVLANSTTGIPAARLAMDLLSVVDEREPTLPTPWRPTLDLPALVRDVVGVWHWGNTPVMFVARGCEQVEVVATIRGAEAYRFRMVDDELVGTSGYHDGEVVRVHRRPGGSVSHLEIATFIYTRTPYDPGVEIPGGHP